jgi:hypothetical protein
VLGFQQWMGSLDAARVSPADQDPTFRRQLPYAVAFGLASWLVEVVAPVLGAVWSDPSTFYYHQIGTFTSDVSTAATPPSSERRRQLVGDGPWSQPRPSGASWRLVAHRFPVNVTCCAAQGSSCGRSLYPGARSWPLSAATASITSSVSRRRARAGGVMPA